LDKYADGDVSSIENPKVLKLKPFSDIGSPKEIINDIFGGKSKYENVIAELERELFTLEKSA
jgi:type I restriction enzyme, R subunit